MILMFSVLGFPWTGKHIAEPRGHEQRRQALKLGACSHTVVQIRVKLAIEQVSAVPAGRN